MYSANVPIYSIAACDSGQSLAVAGNDGSLLLLRIDPNSSKMALQQARHLVQSSRGYNDFDDGPVVDMHPLEHDSQSVIIYATLYGAIICWDLRMPNNAWRLSSDLKQGVITTFCIDPSVSWLATGTSGGNHICYDLRFRLPIAKIHHPSGTRIRKVMPHPTDPWLFSTSHGHNEVSIWNIETGHRQAALWASNTPPLSKEISVSTTYLPKYVCNSCFQNFRSDIISIYFYAEKCIECLWSGELHRESFTHRFHWQFRSTHPLLGSQFAR